MPSGVVTITFEEVDGNTRVVSSIVYPTAEDLNKVIEMGMEQGATETWDRLAEILASMNE
jgi:uncharacterized protein YndB with AHSA1/START domain